MNFVANFVANFPRSFAQDQVPPWRAASQKRAQAQTNTSLRQSLRQSFWGGGSSRLSPVGWLRAGAGHWAPANSPASKNTAAPSSADSLVCCIADCLVGRASICRSDLHLRTSILPPINRPQVRQPAIQQTRQSALPPRACVTVRRKSAAGGGEDLCPGVGDSVPTNPKGWQRVMPGVTFELAGDTRGGSLPMRPGREKVGKRSRSRLRSRSRNAVSLRGSGVKSTKFLLGGILYPGERFTTNRISCFWPLNAAAHAYKPTAFRDLDLVRSLNLAPPQRDPTKRHRKVRCTGRARASVHPSSLRRSCRDERGQSGSESFRNESSPIYRFSLGGCQRRVRPACRGASRELPAALVRTIGAFLAHPPGCSLADCLVGRASIRQSDLHLRTSILPPINRPQVRQPAIQQTRQSALPPRAGTTVRHPIGRRLAGCWRDIDTRRRNPCATD